MRGLGRWIRGSGPAGWLLALALALHLDLDLPLALWMAAEAGPAAGVCTSEGGRGAPAGQHDHALCPLCHGAVFAVGLAAPPPALPLPAGHALRRPLAAAAAAPGLSPAPVYRSRAPPGPPLA